MQPIQQKQLQKKKKLNYRGKHYKGTIKTQLQKKKKFNYRGKHYKDTIKTRIEKGKHV